MSRPRHFIEAPENAESIRPLHDYLLVRPLERAGMIGGIIIPEMDSIDNKNGVTAEVIAAGPGRMQPSGDRIPMEIKVGEHVHIAAYGTTAAGAKIQLNGEKLIMIRARDVNGVVEKEA